MTIELNPTTGMRFDVFGPTVEFLTSPQDVHNDFCVLKGVIPPGVSIPLHSHPDTEDFFVLSGQAQALEQVSGGHEWIEGKAGDHIHVSGGVPHAWRNVSGEPLVALILTTTRLGRFSQETGRPVTASDARGSRALCDGRCRLWVLVRHARGECSHRDSFELLKHCSLQHMGPPFMTLS